MWGDIELIGFTSHGQIMAILMGSLVTITAIVCYTAIVIHGMHA